jgi:hypothetical protein
MTKEFTPYDRALKLKELGFDESCLSIWNNIDGELNFLYVRSYHWNDDLNELSAVAPTFSQAFRWFREEYNLTWEHQFDDSNISLYVGEIAYPDNNLDFFKIIEVEYGSYNKAYEAAELACLDKLIEIVKQKKKNDTKRFR